MADAADGLVLKTVVIDPGHGGKDPGAVSKDKKTYEKTIVLDISRKLADKIRAAYPGVKVVLTRNSDEFVSLDGRAAIANGANADLFISIHINSASSSSPNGYSMHLLGQSSNKDRDLFAYNMDVCKKENSVISLEDDVTKYEDFDPDDPESLIFAMLMQSAFLEQSLKFAQIAGGAMSSGPIQIDRGVWQNPFYVLWKTSMPAVLMELGFISNSTDLNVLRDDRKREEIASRLFNAFRNYKTSYDGQAPAASTSPSASTPAEPPVAGPGPSVKNEPAPSAPSVEYGVQIFAVSRSLSPKAKEFLGYEPRVFNAGIINRYVIGVGTDLKDVQKKYADIRKKYPESFIVKITGNNLERFVK